MARYNVYDTGIKVQPEARPNVLPQQLCSDFSPNIQPLMKRNVSDTGSI